MVTKLGVDTVSPQCPTFVLADDVRRSLGVNGCPKVLTVADVEETFGHLAELEEQDVLVVGTLDSKCRLTYCSILAINPPDLYQIRSIDAILPAINAKASSVILVQRQSRRLSREKDQILDLTQRIAEAGLLLGYPLMDHVVFAHDGSVSSVMSVEALRFSSRRVEKAKLSGRRTQDYRADWTCGQCRQQNTQSWQKLSNAILGGQLALPTRCTFCREFSWLEIDGPPLLSRSAKCGDDAVAQRVLILDDNSEMRSLIGDMLRAYGYDALEASNEVEASILVEKFASSIHTLLADVALGNADGRLVAARLVEKHPYIRVVFMSGYLEDCMKGPNCGSAFIQKPFTIKSLLTTIQTSQPQT